MAALCAVAGISLEAFSSESVAFGIAPRLNVAGRMADPQVALDLLLTDDPALAEELSAALDEHNRFRQAAEADLDEAAIALAERVYSGERALVLAGDGWHEGVKGIVASRLAQQYKVPTFLFSIEDGIAKGSARSVGSVDLFAVVSASARVLQRFGGHAAAVGLSLSADNLEQFREDLLRELDSLPESSFEVSTSITRSRVERAGVEPAPNSPCWNPSTRQPRPIMGCTRSMNDRPRWKDRQPLEIRRIRWSSGRTGHRLQVSRHRDARRA
jgi:single-stranded-DNA-specific exonuclease